MSVKMFAIFISLLIGIFAIAGSLNGWFIKSMVDTQKSTLEAVHSVSERTAKIETWQEILADRMANRNKYHEHPD